MRQCRAIQSIHMQCTTACLCLNTKPFEFAKVVCSTIMTDLRRWMKPTIEHKEASCDYS